MPFYTRPPRLKFKKHKTSFRVTGHIYMNACVNACVGIQRPSQQLQRFTTSNLSDGLTL